MPELQPTSKDVIQMQAQEDRIFQAVLYAAVGAVCTGGFVGYLMMRYEGYYFTYHHAFMPHYYYLLVCGVAGLVAGAVGWLIGCSRPLWKSAV